jgi:hypothetical protein
LKIEGSAMVAYASSKEEILETLKKDIYADSGVWDFSKVCLQCTLFESSADFCRSRFTLSNVLSGWKARLLCERALMLTEY